MNVLLAALAGMSCPAVRPKARREGARRRAQEAAREGARRAAARRAVSFDPRRDARTAAADSPWTVDEMRGGHLAPEHLERIQDEGYETRQKVLDLLEPFVDRRAELSPRLRRELEHDDEAHVPVRTWLVARFPNMEEALAFAVKCRRELRARAEGRRAVRRAARCARELSSDLDGEHWRAPLPSSRSRRQPVRFSAAA